MDYGRPSMRTTDVEAIEAAFAAADDAALEQLAPRIGCVFTHAQLAQLAARAPETKVGAVAECVTAALAEPSGLAFREHVYSRFFKNMILAACDPARASVTVGARVVAPRHGPGKCWPELRPWYKEIERNRAKVTQWALKSADDRVTFKLVARPATASGHDEAELIRNIVEAPHDRALREVLADLWLERGDARGDLARLDLQPPPDAAERIAALERIHAERIAKSVSLRASAWKLRGGFVDSVTMTMKRFAKYGEAMFRGEPIRQLILTPVRRSELPAFAALEHLTLVRALRLESRHLHHTHVDLRLFAARPLPRLEELAIINNMLEGPVFDGLVAPRLRRVDLSECRLDEAALDSLVRTFPKLESVVLSRVRDVSPELIANLEARYPK
jgi:hypothetical protein